MLLFTFLNTYFTLATFLSAKLIDDELVFSVADNGAGIEKERIEAILNGETRTKRSGFGLYSSMQRISLFYGINSPINIISEPGKGTEIIIRTKVLKEGDAFEN